MNFKRAIIFRTIHVHSPHNLGYETQMSLPKFPCLRSDDDDRTLSSETSSTQVQFFLFKLSNCLSILTFVCATGELLICSQLLIRVWSWQLKVLSFSFKLKCSTVFEIFCWFLRVRIIFWNIKINRKKTWT